MVEIFSKFKSLKALTTFMIMCFLLTMLAFNVEASSSKKDIPSDGVIEIDKADSLAKSAFYTIELYKGNASRSFTTLEIEVKGDTDPIFTVKKDGTKIRLEPVWDNEYLTLDVSAYLDAVSTYRYTVSSEKTNFDNDDIKTLRNIKIRDIEDYTTGGEGILDLTGMYLEDMRDLLIESSSALSHVKSLEQSYIKAHDIRVRNPDIDTTKVSGTSMDIVGLALNTDPDDDALRLEFLDGRTKSNSRLGDDLGDDITRSVSIEIDIARGNLSGDDLNFPITITMKPPTGISATDLYILHYYDDVNDDEPEIIKPRKNSGDTITFSTTSFSTFIFVNTSNSGSINTGSDKDKVNGSWGKDPKGWYFIDERGFNPNSTWIKTGNKWYYFDANGYMETGWLEHENKWYYLNSGGDMATGWKHTGSKWYFLNPSGDMATGWKLTGNKWYFLNSGGDMATGWKYSGGKWYFLNPSGDMATGWREVNKVWYYMYSNGQMATSTVTPDGYRVNQSGAWIK